MSSINPNNIDGTYPIAGQDNDSQGFRDNFTNIKNNFTFAYDELTDLQSKAVLKSALNGSTLDNSMTYASLNTSGNVLATGLSVFGNASINALTATTLNVSDTSTLSGNLSSAATHVETGYQQSKPTANVAITVSHLVNRVLIHPTGSIISFGANVTLPNVQVNGTIVNISSNVTIAQLDVRPNWNGVVTVSPFGNATVTAGSNTRYMYIAADYVWYKIA